MPELLLDLPWASDQQLGSLQVHRSFRSVLHYEDGIDLAVRVVDPTEYEDVDDLIRSVHDLSAPGFVVLVAGPVPLAWRSRLRSSDVSFVDVSGVAEIRWPRVDVSTGQFARLIQRRRVSLPMQKGHALVVQQLLDLTFRGRSPTVGEVAESSGVSASTASRAVSQLEAHGLVTKRGEGTRVAIDVVDAVALAELLADRTAWPQGRTLAAYQWGRGVWEIAASISEMANRVGLEFAITGRGAISFLGVLSTSSPAQVRCWVKGTDDDLESMAEELQLEPVSPEESNVLIAADPWGVGVAGRSRREYESWIATIAHPLRVWCDLHDEPRGSEFAAQLWPEIERNG